MSMASEIEKAEHFVDYGIECVEESWEEYLDGEEDAFGWAVGCMIELFDRDFDDLLDLTEDDVEVPDFD